MKSKVIRNEIQDTKTQTNQSVHCTTDAGRYYRKCAPCIKLVLNVLERTVLSYLYSSLITPTSVWPVWLCPSGAVTFFDDDPQRDQVTKTAVRGCAQSADSQRETWERPLERNYRRQVALQERVHLVALPLCCFSLSFTSKSRTSGESTTHSTVHSA